MNGQIKYLIHRIIIFKPKVLGSWELFCLLK